MCNRPITEDGKTFACRTCDECIAKRRSDWVARAMAEKTQWKHTICVTLTYSDETQAGRDAAKMFAYHHVRDFLKRVNSALRRIDPAETLRFICAGEQGDRNGRCHWHLILFSNIDLRDVGKFTLWGKPASDKEEMWTEGKHKVRLHWSLWANDGEPWGFVTLQRPDQAGMAYVLSYCLKDQFTVDKSRGSKRETESENFATGLFRMSKRPAIGTRWLAEKIERLDKAQAVLPNTELTIPGMSGYWYPTGSLRAELLSGLAAVRLRTLWATGYEPPQWAGLLHACQDNPKDMEYLIGSEIETFQQIQREIAFRQRERAGEIERAQTLRRRSWRFLCYVCLVNWDEERREAEGVGSFIADEQGHLSFYEAATGDAARSGESLARDFGQACCEACGQTRYLRAFKRPPAGQTHGASSAVHM